MKKFLVALLSTAMVVSCCNVAWAADALTKDNITSSNGTSEEDEGENSAKSSKDVNVTVKKSIVYSIDVTWGSMGVVYDYGKWNPGAGYTEGGWTLTGNDVTIQNKSNASICWGASFDIADKNKFAKVTAGFYDATQTNKSVEEISNVLYTSEGSATKDGISIREMKASAKLKVEGTPEEYALGDSYAFGTATVTIKTSDAKETNTP